MATAKRTGSKAIAWAKDQVADPERDYNGLCLQFVRNCYDIDAHYPDATSAWANANGRHKTSNANSIPAGVPVWFNTGKHGHIVISLGGGKCISTDIKRHGKADVVNISTITNAWGPLLGWAETLNGVRVYKMPSTPKTVTMSVSALKAARQTDPSKKGTPKGKAAGQVKELEKAFVLTDWLKSSLADGHYGTATVEAAEGFQRKHSGTSKPDGWLGKKELALLARLAGISYWKIVA